MEIGKKQFWGHALKCSGEGWKLQLLSLNIIKTMSKNSWTWFVPLRETQPSLLQIRWTWVSTHIPWTLFHPTFITCKNHKIQTCTIGYGNNNILVKECTYTEENRTKWAILGPIPGSWSKSSSVLGMSPSYFERHILAIFFMLLAFLV